MEVVVEDNLGDDWVEDTIEWTVRSIIKSLLLYNIAQRSEHLWSDIFQFHSFNTFSDVYSNSPSSCLAE